MQAGTDIETTTLQAYAETEYRVNGEAPFVLRVGKASAALLALHRQSRTDSSAFVTAWNPFGEALDDAENAARMSVLEGELRFRGLSFVDGVGQHPSGGWPGEVSFLVLGLALEAAKALGQRHQQNAIIWSGPDAVPQLILLR